MSGWTNQLFNQLVVEATPGGGIFVYSGAPAAGNLIGSWAGQGGTDQFGNTYPAGIFATQGLFQGEVQGDNYVLNPSGLFVYNQSPTVANSVTFSSPGAGTWTAPAQVRSVLAQAWGGGGAGGASVVGYDTPGGGGGGGAYSAATVAVTPGSAYTYVVGAGGPYSALSQPAAAGGNSSFAGSATTVIAYGGAGASVSSVGVPGAGGTVSTSTVSFAGGAGGAVNFGSKHGGGGGGSSGGTAATGNAGQTVNTGATGGAGGSVAGGGSGGAGGDGVNGAGILGHNGLSPGGGGGGAGVYSPTTVGGASSGAGGQVQLTWSSTVPTTASLVTSICGSTASDPLLGMTCPAGQTFWSGTRSTTVVASTLGTLTITNAVTAVSGTASNPTIITTDTWHAMPAMSNSWTTSAHAEYRLTPLGDLQVAFKNLSPGTDTDGTIIWAAGSLTAPYVVSNAHRVVCYTDQFRVGSGTEGAALEFETDGSVQCYGIAAAAGRVDLYTVIPLTD